MTALLWLQVFLLVVIALAFALGVFHLLITRLNAADPELIYRTADAAAMARDIRRLQQQVPAPGQPGGGCDDNCMQGRACTCRPQVDARALIRQAGALLALSDAVLGSNSPNPHPQGSIEAAVWASSYTKTKAEHDHPAA